MTSAMPFLLGTFGLLFALSVTAVWWLLLRARARRALLEQLSTPVTGDRVPGASEAGEGPVPRPSLPLAARIAEAIGAARLFAAVERITGRRRERISRGIPDALDLLVVCVEAGVSLDAALQRVSRELAIAHPELADEITDMSRRLAAGMPRDQAFQSLHARTGVEELRSLATHLIQSERWGTSIANVLRTYSRDLRRRRRRAAEQRAATAATRMLAPMALCIFPTIFIVILGPAVLRIAATFREMAR